MLRTLNRDSASYRRERAEYFNTPRRIPAKADGKEAKVDRDIRHGRPKSIALASSGIPSAKLYSWINAKRARIRIKSFRKCSSFNFANVTRRNREFMSWHFYLFDRKVYNLFKNHLKIKHDFSNIKKPRVYNYIFYFVLYLIKKKRKRC